MTKWTSGLKNSSVKKQRVEDNIDITGKAHFNVKISLYNSWRIGRNKYQDLLWYIIKQCFSFPIIPFYTVFKVNSSVKWGSRMSVLWPGAMRLSVAVLAARSPYGWDDPNSCTRVSDTDWRSHVSIWHASSGGILGGDQLEVKWILTTANPSLLLWSFLVLPTSSPLFESRTKRRSKRNFSHLVQLGGLKEKLQSFTEK